MGGVHFEKVMNNNSPRFIITTQWTAEFVDKMEIIDNQENN